MKNEAIEDLKQIIEAKDSEGLDYASHRYDMLYEWMKKYLVEVEIDQLVMNSQSFSSEYHDFVLEKLVHDALDRVIEEKAATLSWDEKKYKVNMVFLRKKGVI